MYPLAVALFNGTSPKLTFLGVVASSSVEKVENIVFVVKFNNGVVIEVSVITVLTTPLPTYI